MIWKPKSGGAFSPAPQACHKCGEPGEYKFSAKSWHCRKHYRFGQMRASARRTGQYAPSVAELERMLPPDMKCADCAVPMNWLAIHNRKRVITLQHYRDGSIAFVCQSCNARHAFLPGDLYRTMPADCRYCQQCKAVKPLGAFTKIGLASSLIKRKSRCKACINEYQRAWSQTPSGKASLRRSREKRKPNRIDRLDLFCLWMLPFCFIGMAGAALQTMREPEPPHHAQRIVSQAKPETREVVLWRKDGNWLAEMQTASNQGWKP